MPPRCRAAPSGGTPSPAAGRVVPGTPSTTGEPAAASRACQTPYQLETACNSSAETLQPKATWMPSRCPPSAPLCLPRLCTRAHTPAACGGSRCHQHQRQEGGCTRREPHGGASQPREEGTPARACEEGSGGEASKLQMRPPGHEVRGQNPVAVILRLARPLAPSSSKSGLRGLQLCLMHRTTTGRVGVGAAARHPPHPACHAHPPRPVLLGLSNFLARASSSHHNSLVHTARQAGALLQACCRESRRRVGWQQTARSAVALPSRKGWPDNAWLFLVTSTCTLQSSASCLSFLSLSLSPALSFPSLTPTAACRLAPAPPHLMPPSLDPRSSGR